MHGMEDMEDEAASPESSKERPITEEGTPEDTGETISVPKEFLQGTQFKPGDELVLKVVAVSDDGLEVAYAKEPEGGETDESSRESANAELDSMGDGY